MLAVAAPSTAPAAGARQAACRQCSTPPALATAAALITTSCCPCTDLQLTPSKCLVEKCSAVAAGAEFSMWLCDGQLWAGGLPQYGQLGDGDDHEYNAKDCGWPGWGMLTCTCVI